MYAAVSRMGMYSYLPVRRSVRHRNGFRPFVVLRTFDPFATCKAVAESFTKKDAIPFFRKRVKA